MARHSTSKAKSSRSIRLGGSFTKALYQFTLFGTDLNELYGAAQKMEVKMRAMSGLQDVNTDLQISNPQLRVVIRRDRAATLGITPQQIEDALYSAYGSRQVSTIYTPTNQYFVIMEMAPEFQKTSEALSLIYLRGGGGRSVPLDAVAELRREVGPLTVNHLGQVPAVTLSFNLRPGYSLGEAAKVITDLAGRELPATISYGFQGSAQAECAGSLRVSAIATKAGTATIVLNCFLRRAIDKASYRRKLDATANVSRLGEAGTRALLS